MCIKPEVFSIKALSIRLWGFIASTAKKLLFISFSFTTQWFSTQAFNMMHLIQCAINWKIKQCMAMQCRVFTFKYVIDKGLREDRCIKLIAHDPIRSIRKYLTIEWKLFIFLKTSTDAISDVFVVLSFQHSSRLLPKPKSVRYWRWK